MSVHSEEEVISSPLSSAPSSIDDLSDFEFVELQAMPAQDNGPSLLDGLPPFNPLAVPATTERPSSSHSSTGSVKIKTKAGVEDGYDIPAQTVEAHFTTSIEIPLEQPEEHPLNVFAEQRIVTPGATPEPPTSRYGRKRKAPTTTSATKDRAANAKRARTAKKWEVPFVFTDPKSPLVNVNLRAILLHPKAWDVLPPADQEELCRMLEHDRPASLSSSPSPPGSNGKSGKSDESSTPSKVVIRPNLTYLRSDDSFRSDCARYTENIQEGRHDPDWLAESWVAHERRKRGDFREYLRQKVERDWEVKVPVMEVVKEEVEVQNGGLTDGVEKNGEEIQVKDGEDEQKADGEVSGDGEPTKGSPVSSSVGETRFTDLKLEVVPPSNAEVIHAAGEEKVAPAITEEQDGEGAAVEKSAADEEEDEVDLVGGDKGITASSSVTVV
ncbi:Asx homology domain-containing protein [Coniochaeta sp. 2T2.1]|nr:Asx homology domain-containing protein [Coniochaeta sp. 2T2.1]